MAPSPSDSCSFDQKNSDTDNNNSNNHIHYWPRTTPNCSSYSEVTPENYIQEFPTNLEGILKVKQSQVPPSQI